MTSFTQAPLATMYRESAPHSAADLKRWQTELETAVPWTDHLCSLYLRWEPGDPWHPTQHVQRYCLWELLPNEVNGKPMVDPVTRRILEGPDVRSTGHYDPQKRQWVGGLGKGLVDRATQQVFRETGRHGYRWWIIQGSHGGHPMCVPWIVKVGMMIANQPIRDTLPPGDLPYAEPSALTWKKILLYDRFRKWNDGKDWLFRNHADRSAEEIADAERMVAEMCVWWDSQVEEVLDDYSAQRLANIGWDAKGQAINAFGGTSVKGVHSAESSTAAMRDILVEQVGGV